MRFEDKIAVKCLQTELAREQPRFPPRRHSEVEALEPYSNNVGGNFNSLPFIKLCIVKLFYEKSHVFNIIYWFLVNLLIWGTGEEDFDVLLELRDPLSDLLQEKWSIGPGRRYWINICGFDPGTASILSLRSRNSAFGHLIIFHNLHKRVLNSLRF